MQIHMDELKAKLTSEQLKIAETKSRKLANQSKTISEIGDKMKIINILLIGFVVVFFSGCATFRSNLQGVYMGEVKRNPNVQPVRTFYIFTHVEQTIGYDAVPKIVRKNSQIQSFDEIFSDALRKISNTGQFATFTEEASDINKPERRALRDSLKDQFDYTIKIRFVTEKYFSGYFLGTIFSSLTATLVPVPYKQYYRMETEIYRKDGHLVKSYKRSATLTKWVEAFLIFVYPFHPENRKREEVYVAMMHDTFKQIESEGVFIK